MKTVTRSRLAVIVLVASAEILFGLWPRFESDCESCGVASPNYVYLDLTGDPKLVHRFRMYAEDEFEDVGLALTNDPKAGQRHRNR